MKKNTSYTFLYFLISLACLIILICGTELVKHFTRLYQQYLQPYAYQIMTMKLLFPCSLGLLLFFRQHFREKVTLIFRVIVDGITTFVVVIYLFVISKKIHTNIFAQPEALICSTLFLSTFVNSILVWKR